MYEDDKLKVISAIIANSGKGLVRGVRRKICSHYRA